MAMTNQTPTPGYNYPMNFKMTTEIPQSITTPDKVETSIGVVSQKV